MFLECIVYILVMCMLMDTGIYVGVTFRIFSLILMELFSNWAASKSFYYHTDPQFNFDCVLGKANSTFGYFRIDEISTLATKCWVTPILLTTSLLTGELLDWPYTVHGKKKTSVKFRNFYRKLGCLELFMLRQQEKVM